MTAPTEQPATVEGLMTLVQNMLDRACAVADPDIGYTPSMATELAAIRELAARLSGYNCCEGKGTCTRRCVWGRGFEAGRAAPVAPLPNTEKADSSSRSGDDLQAAALEALDGVIREAWRNVCMHEETHRGGVLWEICNACGMKWADDEGGKPEFSEPKAITRGYEVMAKLRAALSARDQAAEARPQNELNPVSVSPLAVQGEPVAWQYRAAWTEGKWWHAGLAIRAIAEKYPDEYELRALYTSPPLSPELTDEEIYCAWDGAGCPTSRPVFARIVDVSRSCSEGRA